jgi:hypothetical protein
MEKEPEGEVEEKEKEKPYHLLPELNELEEDAEVPESKKELECKLEEPEERRRSWRQSRSPLCQSQSPPCQSPTKRSERRSFS